MSRYIIVSFFTPEYKKTAEEYLLPSVLKLGLEYYVTEIANKGSWLKNCQFKPAFLLDCMLRFPDKNIVWIDVDARIHETPVLFATITEDLGISYLNYQEHYNRHADEDELLSGTMFFRNNPTVYKLIEAWSSLLYNNHETEQKALQGYLAMHKEHGCSICRLPRAYCYVNSLPSGKKPFVPLAAPVIEHFQASRVNKKKVRSF